MKKILKWSLVIIFVVLLIDLGIIGIKIFSHDYDVIPESYIGYACFLMLAVCGILMLFSTRCPHCGKVQITKGKYCPYCGNEKNSGNSKVEK